MAMSTGAQRAEAQPGDGTADGQESWNVLSETRDFVGPEPWPDEVLAAEPEQRSTRARVTGALLILLALAWTAASVWTIASGSPALTLPNVLQWIAFVSPPLILFGIAWLILGVTPRRETERFTRAVAAMRSESSALESVLAIVATRLEERSATRLRTGSGGSLITSRRKARTSTGNRKRWKAPPKMRGSTSESSSRTCRGPKSRRARLQKR
jgi:hypothetical protein